MSKEMGRQRLLGTWILAVGLVSGVAAVAQPPAATLKDQAQAEFAKVAFAVRQRLEREAAGDLIGARIAMQDADAHRYRFLGLERELSRLHSGSPASPSVEAVRSPFVPDDSFSLPAAAPATPGAATTVGRQDPVKRAVYAEWDMYRPHELRNRAGSDAAEHPPSTGATPTEPPGRAGDMYSKGASKPMSSAPDEAPTDLPDGASPREPARAPFLVYRDRPAGRDPHE
jgi:type II secretory pathway pseudopilin PulG